MTEHTHRLVVAITKEPGELFLQMRPDCRGSDPTLILSTGVTLAKSFLSAPQFPLLKGTITPPWCCTRIK